MNEKQQTAVQWLENELRNRYAIASTHECIDLFNKALAMEWDQMIYFAGSFGYSCGFDGTEFESCLSAEDYFNDTYQTEP